MVYDEVIVINISGLNKNMKINIIDRGELEMEKMSENDNILDQNENIHDDNSDN